MTLEELKKLCDAATPGPWGFNDQGGYVCFFNFYEDGRPRQYVSAPQAPGLQESSKDAAFIAAARTYLPKLIAVAETARMLADSWRCHDTNFETAVYQDRMFRDLAALEAE